MFIIKFWFPLCIELILFKQQSWPTSFAKYNVQRWNDVGVNLAVCACGWLWARTPEAPLYT